MQYPYDVFISGVENLAINFVNSVSGNKAGLGEG